MKLVKLHGDLTLEKFWLNWFGPLGRELGTNKYPHRNWTDNPDDLLKFIKICAKEHEEGEYCRPCWITAQPMRYISTKRDRLIGETCAIEKLFFDFDDDTKYCSKCDEYIKKDDLISEKEFVYGKKEPIKRGSLCPKCKTECKEKPRLNIVGEEVKKFVENLRQEPFVVETRKGYHVYIFLCQIFTFEPNKFEFAKKVYEELQRSLIMGTYEFMDERIIGDLMRFARVPMTAHEKTGKICQVVNRKLKPTKIRNLEFYRTYGITPDIIKKAIAKIKKREYEAYQKTEETLEEMETQFENGFHKTGRIRPCFQKRMDSGEMCHGQRLAWLSEIYYAGYNTKEKMLELCKCFSDFNERKSMEQINDYFKHERWKFKPYKCSTIKQKGWCLEKQCPFYK